MRTPEMDGNIIHSLIGCFHIAQFRAYLAIMDDTDHLLRLFVYS